MSRPSVRPAAFAAGNSFPAATGTTRSADGFPLHFHVRGNGEPLLILIHGWACSQAFWREQIAPFAARWRVATLDLGGHGLSLAGAKARACSIEALGGDVVAIADALGAPSVALVGHSMGGAVAIEAAAQLGARCRFLLGVDTFDEAAFYARRPDAEIAARRQVFEGDFAGTMRGMVRNITARDAAPELVGWIGDAMAATDAEVALGVLEALLAWDIEAHWPPAVPVATINSAMLARRNALLDLPGLDIHRLEGVGHFPMMEDPATFNALAITLLDRHLR